MLMMTDRLDRLFSTDNRLLRRARDIGIAAVDGGGGTGEATVHAPSDGAATDSSVRAKDNILAVAARSGHSFPTKSSPGRSNDRRGEGSGALG